ncbi:hypothetical protein EPO04_00705 [Patescibacteria group bacterium]|nr:MAG: hypothetical protein EPO04_00705 [Patescibacteria group bacterium]
MIRSQARKSTRGMMSEQVVKVFYLKTCNGMGEVEVQLIAIGAGRFRYVWDPSAQANRYDACQLQQLFDRGRRAGSLDPVQEDRATQGFYRSGRRPTRWMIGQHEFTAQELTKLRLNQPGWFEVLRGIGKDLLAALIATVSPRRRHCS